MNHKLSSLILKNSKLNKKAIVLALILFIFIFPTSILALNKLNEIKKTANTPLLSPLADNPLEIKTIKPEKIYSLEYYLHLAKSFLAKATRLANDNTQQTETDKVKIITTLNEALKAINQAIDYYPNRPEPYLTRAQIYQKLENLWPEARKKAQADLTKADQLLNNQTDTANIPLEKEAQPLNFIPAQKAQLATNITIAIPEQEQKSINEQNSLTTNTLSDTGILKAQQTETKIYTNQLTPDTLVYIVPKTNPDNQVLYLKSRNNYQQQKETNNQENNQDQTNQPDNNQQSNQPNQNNQGWFIVATDKPLNKDIEFNWWLIKQ